ncbi:MAG: cyclic nucleotide-binding domain-containing protein [Bdellovibrionales bacterium]
MSIMVSFDNFAPRLRKGRVIPQGRRLIYETEDGEKQIVLPIEMADAILLATGKYTMRQIIEKIFKLKGSLHFRTLFKTIHQLRDHGFLENGEELESHSWWTSPYHEQKSWTMDLTVVRRKTLRRPRTLHFYFLGLAVVALSLLSMLDMPWPPLSKQNFAMNGSLMWSVLICWAFNSLLQTIQSLFKTVFQLLLTGNMFGLSLRIAPWGVYLRATDEPIFLITNRLFLMLYHAATLLTPFLASWPLQLLDSNYYSFAIAICMGKLMIDLSPFTSSLFMQTVRSMLSLGQSDLIAGYLREDSLLALLSPVDRPSSNRRLHRYFTIYILSWAAFSLWFCSIGLHGASRQVATDPWASLFCWTIFCTAVVWIAARVMRHMSPLMVKPMMRIFALLRSWVRAWRPIKWTPEKTMNALTELPLFSYFSKPLLEMILKESQINEIRGGSRLITQGEIGRDLFVLLQGTLLVERSSFDQGRTQLSILRPVTIFGETAIIEESERGADVIARETSTVLKIPTHVLRFAAKESQYVREIEAFRNAITVNQFFTSAPMFKDLPEDTVHDITMRSSLRHLSPNEHIIRQGSQGRSFFMVLRGAVEVRINEQPVKKIRQGGFFGEIALIADIPRTASVVTVENSVIMEMAAVNFWEILCQNIELAMFIEAVGESRLSEDLMNNSDEPEPSEKAG